MTGPTPNDIPSIYENMVQFALLSLSDTLSASITLVTTSSPAQAIPWRARPNRRRGKADVGEPVQMALPTIMMAMFAWRVVWRPKMSHMEPQKGMKAAKVRLKAETIQFCCWSSPWVVLAELLEALSLSTCRTRLQSWEGLLLCYNLSVKLRPLHGRDDISHMVMSNDCIAHGRSSPRKTFHR